MNRSRNTSRVRFAHPRQLPARLSSKLSVSETMLQAIKNYFRDRSNAKRIEVIRTAFNDGKTLTRFVAKDVRREIKVVNIDEIDSGFIVAQIRTNNILYLRKKLTAEQSFGEPQKIALDELWEWTGQPWGGLPDGTSIADHIQLDSTNPQNDG